jgi:hypothetical protein
MVDLHLLKIGRHFRLHPRLKIILGRNRSENEQIQAMERPGSVFFKPLDFRGPTCLASGSPGPEAESRIGKIMAGYSQEEKPRYQIKKQILGGDESFFFVEQNISKETSARLQIGG